MQTVVRLYDSVREWDSGSPRSRVDRIVAVARHVGRSADQSALCAHFEELKLIAGPDGQLSFLEFWKTWDAWPGLAPVPDAGIVQGMRTLRDGVLSRIAAGSELRTSDLRNILTKVMEASDDPGYWGNVLAALPPPDGGNDAISLDEVSDAVHIWLVDFLGGSSAALSLQSSDDRMDDGGQAAPERRSSSFLGVSGLELLDRLVERGRKPSRDFAILRAWIQHQEEVMEERSQALADAKLEQQESQNSLQSARCQFSALQEEFAALQEELEEAQHRLSQERSSRAALAKRCTEADSHARALETKVLRLEEEELARPRLRPPRARGSCESESFRAGGRLVKSLDSLALEAAVRSYASLAEEEGACCRALQLARQQFPVQAAASSSDKLLDILQRMQGDLRKQHELLSSVELDDPAAESPRHRSLSRNVAFFKLQLKQIDNYLQDVHKWIAHAQGNADSVLPRMSDLADVFTDSEERLYTVEAQKANLEQENRRLGVEVSRLQTRLAQRDKGLTASTWAGDDDESSAVSSVFPIVSGPPKTRPRPPEVPRLPLPLVGANRKPSKKAGGKCQTADLWPGESLVEGWVQYFQDAPVAQAASSLTRKVPTCGPVGGAGEWQSSALQEGQPRGNLNAKKSSALSGTGPPAVGSTSRKPRRKAAKEDDCQMM